MSNCLFEFCDFENSEHLDALISLLGHYMEDPMGNHAPFTKQEQLCLVKGLASHPKAFVMFARKNNGYFGLMTCFELFSTFQAKPYLYIHDVVIHKDYRGKGLGRKMMEQLVTYSKDKNYCKITLEVRSDNPVAQNLYQSLGFKACKPDMYFRTKQLI